MCSAAEPAARSFRIRIAVEERETLILQFHEAHLTEHLWPRTLEEFRGLIRDECLLEAVETTNGAEDIVGLCYIMHGEEPEPQNLERSEFGGISVADSCRGLGIATALGIVAISNHFAWDPPTGRLIAHVHEANQLPRGLLQNQLGFEQVGQEIPPPEIAPANLARNDDGNVVGDLFEFSRSALNRFADWIEGFAGTLRGAAGTSQLEVALPLMAQHRTEAVEALRAIAAAG